MNNCVCCGEETNGTYGDRFPVCYDCYAGKDLKLTKLFYTLVNRHTMKLHWYLNKYLEEVNDAAEEWKENYKVEK